MAINRSLMERQLRMGGGIMNAMPRQQYGLGSFVKKAVKGVTGAVKKIAGSDVGKLALTAGALYGLGGAKFLGGEGIFARGQGLSRFANLANLPAALGIGKSEGITPITKNFPGGGMGLAATAAGLTGFMSAQGISDEQIEEIKQNPEALKGYLDQYYRNLNPPTADTNSQEYEAQVSNFVQRNLKADGGRMRFADGMPEEGIASITPMKKPDNNVQYVRDTIKSLDGFAQLIAQEGNLDRKTFEGHMDLFEDFRQRKDIDAMPAYTYLQRRVQELNPEVAKMIVFDYSDKPNFANGGRIGFEDGTPKSLLDMIKIEASGSKSGKQQISGAPEGFTIDKETFNAILKADIPLSEKIDFLASYQYGKDRNRIEKDNQELFLGEGGFKDRNIGLGFNKDGEGFGGTLMYNMETGEPEFKGTFKKSFAEGGRLGYAFGSPEENAIQASGIMNLPLNQNPAGITELDLRDNGGFIPPVGVKEKADDIPAMLSNNEFVFTADAVRGMGDGDVNVGAQRMYDMMKKLEGGGRV